MGEDDLNRPLGVGLPKASRSRLGLALGLLVLCGAFALSAVLILADPRGGEPFAVAVLPPPPAPAARTSLPPAVPLAEGDPMPTGSVRAANPAAASASPLLENGVSVFRAGTEQKTAGPLVIRVPQALGLSEVAAVDTRLIEQTRYGPLPKIALDGARASEIYARPPVFSGRIGPGTPRLAVIVTDLGLDRSATDNAVKALPAAVTLAFSPYGEGLDAAVERAKAAGHEVLLQLAVNGDTGTSPAPHALRGGATRAETIDDLHWLMSRMSGYVGVSNLLGGSLATDQAAMTTMLQEIDGRGLLYAGRRGVTDKGLAPPAGLPVVDVDLPLGEEADAATLRAAMVKLEATARAKGRATLAVSGGVPAVAAVASFLTTVEARGLALVPASTLAAPPPAIARTP